MTAWLPPSAAIAARLICRPRTGTEDANVVFGGGLRSLAFASCLFAASTQMPNDVSPRRLLRELRVVTFGDTSVELSFAPKQFVLLSELADELLREGVLSRIERVTTDGATVAAGAAGRPHARGPERRRNRHAAAPAS
jgi:hypothetical protein